VCSPTATPTPSPWTAAAWPRAPHRGAGAEGRGPVAAAELRRLWLERRTLDERCGSCAVAQGHGHQPHVQVQVGPPHRSRYFAGGDRPPLPHPARGRRRPGDDGRECGYGSRRGADGIETIVATPHVSYDYPTDPAEIGGRVAEVNAALAAEGIALTVVGGAEVALSRLPRDRQAAPAQGVRGGGPYLLVEPPHSFVSDSLERLVFELQVDGFRPVLAHVERCPGVGSSRSGSSGWRSGGWSARSPRRPRPGASAQRSATSRATCSGEGWFTTWPRTLMGRWAAAGAVRLPGGRGARRSRAGCLGVGSRAPFRRPWCRGRPSGGAAGPRHPRGGGAAWRRVMRSVRDARRAERPEFRADRQVPRKVRGYARDPRAIPSDAAGIVRIKGKVTNATWFSRQKVAPPMTSLELIILADRRCAAYRPLLCLLAQMGAGRRSGPRTAFRARSASRSGSGAHRSGAFASHFARRPWPPAGPARRFGNAARAPPRALLARVRLSSIPAARACCGGCRRHAGRDTAQGRKAQGPLPSRCLIDGGGPPQTPGRPVSTKVLRARGARAGRAGSVTEASSRARGGHGRRCEWLARRRIDALRCR